MTAYNKYIKYRVVVSEITYGIDSLPYTNLDFGINNGVLTLDSSSDLMLKINNSVAKINISKGGNLGGGYTFGFSIINDLLSKALNDNGVFLSDSKCDLQIDIGSGFITEWSGKINSIKTISETEVAFTCTDATKRNNSNIGSDSKGICLNRNYFCKLNNVQTNYTDYPFDATGDILYTPVYRVNKNVHGDTLPFCITIRLMPSDSEWIYAFNSGEQLFLKVGAGDDSGSTYTVLSVTLDRVEGDTVSYNIFTLEDPDSIRTIAGRSGSSLNDCSLVKLIHYDRVEVLSEKQCHEVHTSLSTHRQPLTVYDGDNRFYLSAPYSYTPYYDITKEDQMVLIRGLSTETQIVTKNSISLSSENTEYFAQGNPLIIGFDVNSYLNITQADLKKMSTNSIDGGFFIDFDSIDIPNLFDGTPTFNSVLSSKISVIGYYKNNIMEGKAGGAGDVKYTILEEQEITDSTTATILGSSLNIAFDFSVNQPLQLSEFSDYDMYSKFAVLVRFSGVLNANVNVFNNSVATFNNARMVKQSKTSLNEYSIGCTGENVQSGNEYESVTDTIKYIQTDYLGVDLADIDSVAYAEAEDKFNSFPSFTTRNPAHQITTSTDGNKVLKDILFVHHLGMFIDKSGKWSIKNWLPDSIAFYNNILPVKLFNEKNVISISNISRDDLNNVMSEFELKYDFNEALNRYNEFNKKARVISITGTNDSVFDFDKHVSGVSVGNSQNAEEAWLYLQSGYRRIKRLSKEVTETKWIKHEETDIVENGSGEGEALSFIRNQASHVTRPHEYITITVNINSENLALDLLSFISIRDQKITDGVERLGWIVERKIDTREHLLVFTVLLDVSATDPFLVEIGGIQDDPNELGNEYEDDATEVNEILDGDGK